MDDDGDGDGSPAHIDHLPNPAPPPRPANSSITPEEVSDQQQHSHSPLDRPRSSRNGSLPHTLFAPDSASSIFGSPPTPTDAAPSPASPTLDQDIGSAHTTLQPPPMLRDQPCHRAEGASRSVDTRVLPRVEKDADDPSTPLASAREARRTESNTLTTLSRLFAVQATTSPNPSRNSSYTHASRQPFSYTRSVHSAEVAQLPDHLYTRGFLEGRHSDITVHAFGQQYRLHRLILDRSAFFSSALSEPWLEANAKEMTVHPEDIDCSITQASFELALKRLYGCYSFVEEDYDPVGLFATGCWLEMQDLIDSSIESMLRQMTPETLSPLIKLVTGNYYGRAGDKILASAKSMLCRDGWQMLLRHWDGIPGDIVREIVGGDGFFIDSEWDRWILARRILNRRLRAEAIASGLIEPGRKSRVQKVPDAANLRAVRFDTVYRLSSGASERGLPHVQKWVTLYTNPDIEPLLVLLDEGVHYIHLEFEQLQFIRKARDCLGLPVVPEKVVSNALWQQMELRKKVVNAREVELELGLSLHCKENASINTTRDTTMSITTSSHSQRLKGKRKAADSEEGTDEIDNGSWDGNGRPRKFWIPSSDCNIVMGGNADPIIATPTNISIQRHANRLSTTLQPEDVQWAADFAAFTSQPRPPSTALDRSGSSQSGMTTISYTHFPPFRFAAEFPNPRMLKEKKRVYSRTVFYAGSLWNIYIQKVASSRSKQLGVYLHRAKERETEEVIAGTAGLAHGSVDERIGQLEREMLMRGERQERRQRGPTPSSDGVEDDGGEGSAIATGGIQRTSNMHDGPDAGCSTANARDNATRRVLSHRTRDPKTAELEDLAASSATTGSSAMMDEVPTPDWESSSDHESDSEQLAAASSHLHVPALPAYVDARPTIKTYFKIYSPSRGGRMLSVYESAPDKFNFSQSWGWKSTTLMLDDGLGDDEDVRDDTDLAAENGSARTMNTGDGKLRFMVVIGNI